MEYEHFIHTRNIGVEVPKGWQGLVDRIFQYCDEVEYRIQVMQIKEKFGSLRFYYDMAEDEEFDPKHDRYIQATLDESIDTCIGCGVPVKEVREDGWVRVTCDPCEVDYQKRRRGL